jgi:hypothetical protein
MNKIKRYIYIQARPNQDGIDVRFAYVRVTASSAEAAYKKGFKQLLEQDGYNGRVANDLVIPVREQKDETQA